MASWYGDSTFEADGKNCWLKELELVCQYPADLEQENDGRYLLLARPTEECEALPSLVPVSLLGVLCRASLRRTTSCQHASLLQHYALEFFPMDIHDTAPH